MIKFKFYLGTTSIGTLGWFYQSCTEFVIPICSNGISDMFDIRPWNSQAWSNYCFTQWHVWPHFEWPYMEFRGKNIKTNFCYYSNIISTNDNLDSWSSDGLNSTMDCINKSRFLFDTHTHTQKK
jgi:lysosomal Pro-X carboxypeptidase